MAVIKVSPTIFSPIKTIEKGLAKAKDTDEIHVTAGIFKETLHFHRSISMSGKNVAETIIKGSIIIPKNCHVQFEAITFIPTAHIYIEGTATFHNCHFDGSQTGSIMTVNKGNLTLRHCQLQGAMDVGVSLFNESSATIQHSRFKHNGKTQLLVQQSNISLTACELSHATHALWLKKGSTGESCENHFHQHTGTHIMIQQQARFTDRKSHIEQGRGNGIFATNEANISLEDTIIQKNALPQLWIQQSECHAINCTVAEGHDSGLVARENATITLSGCTFADHKSASLQAALASRLNIEHTTFKQCEGIGVQLRDKSIATFSNVTFTEHKLTQLLATNESIVSLKNCQFSNGGHVGISLDKGAHCTAIHTKVLGQKNTGIAVIGAELMIMDCEVSQNDGNGILAVEKARLQIDQVIFLKNGMPHIAGKAKVDIKILQSQFSEGKSFYVLDQSTLSLIDCELSGDNGVQFEITDQTTATLKRCKIHRGKSNAIKVLRDSSITIEHSTISQHELPQVVINDSSIVMKDCEIIEGKRNGFIIENNSEAHIQDTFIAQHAYPQIWIDLESSVELVGVHLSEGAKSDIYAQNRSKIHATKCIIRNNRFAYNVQAINHSAIRLNECLIENHRGETFYSENNSTIVHLVDEINE